MKTLLDNVIQGIFVMFIGVIFMVASPAKADQSCMTTCDQMTQTCHTDCTDY